MRGSLCDIHFFLPLKGGPRLQFPDAIGPDAIGRIAQNAAPYSTGLIRAPGNAGGGLRISRDLKAFAGVTRKRATLCHVVCHHGTIGVMRNGPRILLSLTAPPWQGRAEGIYPSSPAGGGRPAGRPGKRPLAVITQSPCMGATGTNRAQRAQIPRNMNPSAHKSGTVAPSERAIG